MKILHTADWHMNDTLGRVDRSVDIYHALERIAAYLEEYRVDVMLVAGDLFSEPARPEKMRAAVAEIRRIFLPFLERGGTVLTISGNHDSEVFFETLRDALDLVAPGRAKADGSHGTGRFYVAPNPVLRTLTDGKGALVQFVLMPYPTARCYLRGEDMAYRSVEEKHAAIQRAFVQTLKRLEGTVDPRFPCVLVSHVHIRGAKVHSSYRVTEADDVVFEPADIPAHWAYVAYGHIHKPQAALPGATHVRYAGSIERLDAGDGAENKSVVLCEIGPHGLVGEPTLLPLASTPIYRIEITDPDMQISELATTYPDAQRALVHYTLHYRPGTHDHDALCRRIQEVFPRWYGRELHELGAGGAAVTFTPQQLGDVAGTVRSYLVTRLVKHPDRTDLFALADALLAEEVPS